jgi:hypothetical protein
MDIQKIATAAGSTGLIGALFASGSKDTFKDTKKTTATKSSPTEADTDAELTDLFMKFEVIGIVIGVISFILAILFLFAIYKMVPDYKVLHTVMSLLFSSLWYVPVLFYYCVIKDYTLTPMTMTASTGANNNRSRNSARYL